MTGAEISREAVSIDTYTGLNSEAIGAGAFANGSVGPVSVLDPPNYLPLRHDPDCSPATRTSFRSTPRALYVLETANYRDFIILNGGLRFDQYDISASKIGYPTISADPPACGTTISAPSSSRCRSPASMRPTARRPNRSAPNSTAHRPITAASIRRRRSIRFSARSRAKAAGSRHQMGTVRPASAGDRRPCSAPMSAMPAN